ncbi:MAG: fasciclin domain-containing protein [Gemmatimonadota bacterium]|nr:fasciclin domain-containing protein [Gemmatimonadota bacterium]
MNIVETASAAGSFNTLLTAAKAAGLAETLAGKGPFTVFAPTDEAFAALPAGTLDALLKDTEKLKTILLYHVVSGKVTAKDVAGLKSAKTLQGGELKIDTSHGVMINNAMVVKADVMASNGVIHVINKVLLP